MRIAFITDTHGGYNKDNPKHIFIMSNIFAEFGKFCTEKKVDEIFHLGDVFHNKEEIGTTTITETNKMMYDLQKQFPITIIAGNHDFRYKTSDKICSIKEFKFSEYKNIKIITKPTVTDLDGKSCLLLPYPTVFDPKEVEEVLNDRYDLLLSHFSTSGFMLTNTQLNDTGFDVPTLTKFAHRTFLGHFHLHQEKENVMYVGSPMHFNPNDSNSDRYFVIYDTETDIVEKKKINHLFPNYIKVGSLAELAHYELKDSLVDLYLDPKVANSITVEDYETLISKLKSKGIDRVRIKINSHTINFANMHNDEDEMVINDISLKDVLNNLIKIEATEINKPQLITESINYIGVLYNKAEGVII